MKERLLKCEKGKYYGDVRLWKVGENRKKMEREE
jgi:hypothetical protein